MPPQQRVFLNVQAGNASIPVAISRSARRQRTISLKVDGTGQVRLLAPMGVPHRVLEELAQRKADWLLSRIQRSQDKSVGLISGQLVLYRGQLVSLNIQYKQYLVRPLVQLDACGGVLNMVLSSRMSDSQTAVKNALVQFCKVEAKQYFTSRVAAMAQQTGLHPSRVDIGAATTTWGVCSSRGHVRFSWRAMMLPDLVLDYLIVHELCHLRHLNHSSAFWRLVGTHLPDYKQRQAILKQIERKAKQGADGALYRMR